MHSAQAVACALYTERSPKKSDIQRTRCCMYTMNPPDDGLSAQCTGNCLCTLRSPKKSDIQRTGCCMYTMNPPDDEHNVTRNM